jgi:HlyD family secretion protein
MDLFNINQTAGKVIWFTIVLLIGAGTFYYFYYVRGAGTTSYITAPITRGSLVNKVSATGTVQAVTTVQVGSQASGVISAIYVDFNSEVHKGEVIAELDPASLQAQVQQAQANLEQSNASHLVALANLANARALLNAAQSNVQNQQAGVVSAEGNLKSLKAGSDDALSLLKKQQALYKEGIIAERDLEVAQTGYKTAQAKYEQAQAQVKQAQITQINASNSGIAEAQAGIRQMQSQVESTNAQIKQAEAALKLAKINLSHTTITSPINGVVVSRQVDVGQTVAASLSAPTLFTIANDLTQMQVMANIDEADIGAINQATTVTFSVDAFPGQIFDGNIRQMRLNAITVQNVVTYNVVVNVDNPEQKLKPGMTADLTFVIAKRDSVIKIPNAAFRYVPASVSNGSQRANSNSNSNSGRRQDAPALDANSNTERPNIARATSPVLEGQTRIVWTLDENKQPQRHEVKIGISDGTATEMVEGDLKEGDSIISSETTTGTTRTANTQSAPGFGGAPGGRPGGR